MRRMLILTRKVDQGIVIHDTVVVRVLGIDGERVKLGVTAPSDVLVLRDELCQAVRAENVNAASGSPATLEALRRLPGRRRSSA